MIVAPASSPVFRSPRAAHGLLVVGEGATVSRRGALASLLRGEMGNAIVGGGAPGRQAADRALAPAGQVTFYVALPPPAKSPQRSPLPDRRRRARLPRCADRHLDAAARADLDRRRRTLGARARAGEQPSIRAEPRERPAGPARALRPAASAGTRLPGPGDARAGRAADPPLAGRAADPRPRALSRRLPRAFGVHRLRGRAQRRGVSPRTAVLGVALPGGGGALLGGWLLPPRLPLALALAAFFTFLFAVMWAEPGLERARGDRPPPRRRRPLLRRHEPGRDAAATARARARRAGRRALPAAGRDCPRRRDRGEPRRRRRRRTGGLPRRLPRPLARLRHVPALRAAAATAVAAGAALLLVGIDAATGGSSHVTNAVGGGPGSVLGDLGHRLHLSAASVSSTWNSALLFALGLVGLVVLALQRPRSALLDAYLVALAVSFLVNDTPTDVAGYGGFAALGLWLLTRSEEGRGRLE